ncbi:uncharacterized protein LOC106067741 [Biomphalaria glabrata]|uniref:Uncharacterized protein LOC106067741 n=1 Tax=Biomphalaria glabrata TaxID=6526 RepID=A0A9W2YFB6_BIOGL|nr:uncharacterized protein LOC106067741 [Biomphalaria glabrata]
MELFDPPKPLSLDGNLSERWKKWRQSFELFMVATEKNTKPEPVKKALLLHLIGEPARDIYNTFQVCEDETVDKVIERFQNHFLPKSNTVYDRFKFFSRKQKDGETFEQYYTELKNLAKECKFDNLRDELIRDRLVCGIQSDRVKERLLRDVDLTLEKAASIIRADEHTQNQMIDMKGLHVDAANKLKKTEDRKPVKTSQGKMAKNHVTSFISDCRSCGGSHGKYNCPAFGQTCRKCKKRNHFAVKCRSKHFKAVKEKLLPHAVPDRPWKKVATDLFEWRNNDYLLVVDYFSKYPEIKRLENKTAECVIRAMKGIFARHGIPEEIVSDNMPFNSYQYREFASEWGFKITTSSPRYPQSNGQSEVYVGIVKQIFNKAYKSGKDPYLAMLEYRNTPISGLLYSPSQLLMSRRLRDIIPTDPKLLKPSVAENAETLLNERQRKSKVKYDSKARLPKDYSVGEKVRVRLGQTWQKAVVIKKHPSPRSYIIKTNDGKTYRRNQRFLNKSYEEDISGYYDTDEDNEQQTVRTNKTDNYKPTSRELAVPVKTTRSGRVVKIPCKYKY